MSSWEVQGGSVEISPEDPAKSVLRLFVKGASALPLTLLLQRQDVLSTVDAANTDSPVVCRVRFGSLRVGDEVEVDVETGTALTVPWGDVEVIAVYERDPDAGDVRPPQRVIASAYAGARQGSVHPTRRRRLGFMPASSRTFVPVPPYAAEVALYGIDAASTYGVTNLFFCRAPAGRELAELIPLDASPVRIPNGCRSILVANSQDANLTLEFGLCL